jgi:uncharacterized protein YbgA (DUF1722 family)
VAIEEEGRLRNPRIREHFLRQIFTLADFRKIKEKKSIGELVTFHSKNKFIFMSYYQKNLGIIGLITSNQDQKDIDTILNEYEKVLRNTFHTAPSCSRNINVLQHIFGFFSKYVSPDEKKYFLNNIELYRNGQLSLATVTRILESWAIRTSEDYLLQQTFFHPYPKQLIHIENIDSCHVRDYWK